MILCCMLYRYASNELSANIHILMSNSIFECKKFQSSTIHLYVVYGPLELNTYTHTTQFTTNSSDIHPHIWLGDGWWNFIMHRNSIWMRYAMRLIFHILHCLMHTILEKYLQKTFWIFVMTENIINRASKYSFSSWHSTWNLFGCHESLNRAIHTEFHQNWWNGIQNSAL